MPKIAFMINSFSAGGAEKVMSVLISKLNAEKIEMEIICLEKNNFYKLPKNIQITYLSDFDGSENGIKKLIYLPLLAWRLKKIINKNQINVVQSHLYRANYVNVLSRILGGKQYTEIVNHGIVSRYKLKGLLGKINLFLIKELYGKTDLLITISKAMQSDMLDLFNFKNKQIVINNPYDIQSIEKSKSEKVNNFLFSSDKKYLISVGRLILLKRNKDIIKVMKKLPENVELIFLGEGEEKENLSLLAKELGIGQRVHFLGRVENPYKYMAKCDLFINCSESEGFPNVLVESMICGIPVISSDCISGPREILAPDTDVDFQLKEGIEKAEYGILYPVGDVDRLSEAIKELLENIKLRESYKEKAFKRAHDFSLEKIVEQYKKVLNV